MTYFPTLEYMQPLSSFHEIKANKNSLFIFLKWLTCKLILDQPSFFIIYLQFLHITLHFNSKSQTLFLFTACFLLRCYISSNFFFYFQLYLLLSTFWIVQTLISIHKVLFGEAEGKKKGKKINLVESGDPSLLTIAW